MRCQPAAPHHAGWQQRSVHDAAVHTRQVRVAAYLMCQPSRQVAPISVIQVAVVPHQRRRTVREIPKPRDLLVEESGITVWLVERVRMKTKLNRTVVLGSTERLRGVTCQRMEKVCDRQRV